jgi:hypothetical protein
MMLWKRKTKPTMATVQAPVDVEKALDEAKARLSDVETDAWLRARSLEFAQSLLTAVGENPETPQNQLLIHQMAIENLRARQAILAPRSDSTN